MILLLQLLAVPSALSSIKKDGIEIGNDNLGNICPGDLIRRQIDLFRLQLKGNAVDIMLSFDKIGKRTQAQTHFACGNSIP